MNSLRLTFSIDPSWFEIKSAAGASINVESIANINRVVSHRAGRPGHAAGQELAELARDERGQTGAVGPIRRGLQKGLQMLADGEVEHLASARRGR
jgi:hypothetical protein